MVVTHQSRAVVVSLSSIPFLALGQHANQPILYPPIGVWLLSIEDVGDVYSAVSPDPR